VSKPRWPVGELTVRTVRTEDVRPLTEFSSSLGEPWEQEVEDEIRERLAPRYLRERDGELDPRMLVILGGDAKILGVAAHHVEPVLAELPNRGVEELRPTYLEVIAVTLSARRTQVELDDGGPLMTFGEFVYETTLNDVRSRPERAPLIFGRVDRRHSVSLSFCDRVGLTIERTNQNAQYVQRWGDV
jgi:hypothetical protein